ncbi:MAG TPA: carboxypeptidase-like regulatory domain-containing protein [Gemmatimonadaceae bacterium]|nr:carboxypeptidase-like regulatory domain-containing protein [Gemmatimonadaceae bacterium]
MRRLVQFLLVVFIAALARPAFAQQTDVIRGRVTGGTGADTLPLSGVTVKVTSYMGQVTKTTKTDKNGKFNVIFPVGEGDYWVEFTAIGFLPKRFEIKRVADEEILLADAKLGSNVQTLDQVNVIANPNRALPARTGNTSDVSGAEKPLTNSALPPDLAGNLAAMAATVPGIQLIPGMDGAADMFSALGLGGDQNNTTLNGLGSAIPNLPRDVQTQASVRPISYDPSIGGFSGAQISLNTIPGNNFSSRGMSGVAYEPDGEWTNNTAEDQGAKNTYLSFGGRAGGPITYDKHFYNVSYQYDRTFKDLRTLLNTSAVGLNGAGVARDSADRLLGILENKGIPANLSNIPRQSATDHVSLYTNFDMTPHSFGTGNSFNLTLAGDYSKSGSQGFNNVYTVPGHNNETSRYSGNASLFHTNYFWFGVLSRTALGTSLSGNGTEPYLRMPSGTVRVNSTLDDGTAAIKPLSFGGNPQGDQKSRSKSVDFLNTMTWYSGNNHHVLKMTTGLRNEWYSNDIIPNQLGSFSFNSLADLDAGRAASYSRTLFSPLREGNQFGASWSFGDSWIPKQGVQIQFGPRVDFNHFGNTPDANAKIEQDFGVKNTHVPNEIYVSPRAGFQWIYGKAQQIAFVPGAARPPRALIRGGVGMFQNMGAATLIDGALTSTGLPSSTQSISCIGAAAPIPDWTGYRNDPSSIPETCADGTSGTVFSNAAPSATLFDPNYRQQRSLRASLDWAGPILDNRFAFGAQVVYSRNQHQTGSVDLNLDATAPRFTLDNEAGRPVFAPASAIVPTTGSIASSATRVSSDFNRVTELKSDLTGSTKQLYFSLKPVTTGTKWNWDVAYTLQNVTEMYRGFSSTVANPFDVYTGRLQQPGRHTFQLHVYVNPWDLIRINMYAYARSGIPFTPTVAGDINGDGSGNNDRAYIFDPSTTTDTAVANGIQDLLSTASKGVRECLKSQLGRLAGRGTCTGPWMGFGSNVSISFNPQKIGLPQRLNISFNFNNPLLLADLLINGQDNMHGWGQLIPPDQSLLYVRGFDPVSQTYKYEVNRRFGSTRPSQTIASGLTYVSLNVRYDIGFTRERQTLTQRLDVGRSHPGTKYSAAVLKSMSTSTIPNPMAMILQQPDTLKLTRKQADSLAAMSRAYTLKAEELWQPVSRYLEALPNDYDHGEAYDRYVVAREGAVDYLIHIVPAVKKLLTPTQWRMLPMNITNYLDVRVLRAIRSSSAGLF